MTQKRDPQIIPLSLAVLCTNCENVSDSGNDHCEACGSPGAGLLQLKRVLNREGFEPQRGPERLFHVRAR